MGERKRPLVPRLRFPEFQDKGEWEERPLGEVFSFKTTNSYSRDMLNYEKGSVKNIHYGDIHTKFSTLFDVEVEDVPFINLSVSLEKIKPDSYCVEGDIVFADASEDLDDIGKCIEIVNLNNEKLLSGLHTLLARQREEKLRVGFGGYLFKSNKVRAQIKKESQGAKVLGISAGRLAGIQISFPSDKKEQQKIADCLSSLDELISAQNQKVEALKRYKKGLMQQLFPREGETIPRLRFQEFRDKGEWSFQQLGKLASRCLRKNTKGEYTRVLTNSAEYGVVDQRDYFEKDIANQGNLEGYYIIEKGDYVYNPRISKHSPVGPISRNNIGVGILSPLYTVFRFNISDNDFYAHYFKSVHWHHYIRQSSSTGARHDRMSITNDALMGLPLPIAELKEQQKIADCLSSLDELISAQKQKVDALRRYKKGLMQQLFPVLDESQG